MHSTLWSMTAQPPVSLRNQPASGSPASDGRGSTSTDRKQERRSEVDQHPGGTPWPTSCFSTTVQRTPGTGRSTTAVSGTGLHALFRHPGLFRSSLIERPTVRVQIL